MHPPSRKLRTDRQNVELELGGPRVGHLRARDVELELGGPRGSGKSQ
jgi:hypothetical protein